MNKSTLQIIILVASVCLACVRSDLCIKYNGTQCLECVANYKLVGNICEPNLVQIKGKNSKGAIILTPTVESLENMVNWVQIKQKSEGIIDPNELITNQPNNLAIRADAAYPGSDGSPNSYNLVKIARYDPARITGRSLVQPISISDIHKYSVGSTFIQGIFVNFAKQILQNQLNKISLQLFDFARQSNFDQTFDPLLRQVLVRIQQYYGVTLFNFTLQAVYFRYLSFAKLYKIFYADLTSIQSIQINQVDAMVDLFHMQIYISKCSLYSRIPINESTIESIRQSTRNN